MPFFVSAKERDRLLADIDEARERARVAEARLHEMSLAMVDHKAIKDGSYPISSRLPKPEAKVKPPTEEQFRESLKEHHLWPFYLQSAVDARKSEDDAMDALVAQVRGNPLPFEQTM